MEGEQIFGDPIHVAARLQTLAEPGGVCISESLRDQLEGRMEVAFRDLGTHVLKNLPRPLQAFAVTKGSEAPSARSCSSARTCSAWSDCPESGGRCRRASTSLATR